MATYSSLWAAAFQQLGPEKRTKFGQPTPEPIKDILHNIASRASALQTGAAAENWTHRLHNGTVVILRDVFQQIAQCTSQCAAVVDDTSHIDPRSYALPWATVESLMPTLPIDKAFFGPFAEGLKVATKAMAQYAVLEKLCLMDQSSIPGPNASLLRESVLRVYVVILAYLSTLLETTSAQDSRNLETNMSERHEDSSMTLQRDILANDVKIGHLSERLRDEALARKGGIQDPELVELLDRLSLPTNRVADDLWQIEDELETADRRQLLDWLSTVPAAAHLESESKSLLSGTGEWLIQHPNFRFWQNSSASGIFWLRGIPGSGKSKLTAKVAQHLLNQKSLGKENQIPFAYFACSRKGDDKRQTNPHEALLSILRQLAGGSSELPLRGDISQVYSRRKEVAGEEEGSIDPLTREEVLDSVLSITEVAPAIIMIDALDESSEDERGELLEALDRIVHLSANVTKIFVSSRLDSDIASAFKDCTSVEISKELNERDIHAFVEHEFDRDAKAGKILSGQISASLRAEIITTLSTKAQGMFRWVELSLNMLCNSLKVRNEEDIRLLLGKLPSDLQAQYQLVYDEIMQSTSVKANIARRLFSWMLAAQRPLSTAEYLAAISVNEDGSLCDYVDLDTVLSITRNLVREVPLANKDGLTTLQVVHLSVREFLEKVEEMSLTDIHNVVVQRCLHEFDGDIVAPQHPFGGQLRQYTKYLFEHAHLSSLQKAEPRLADNMIKFLWNSNFEESLTFTRWLKLFKEHEDHQFKQYSDFSAEDHLYIKIFSFSRPDIPAINLACRYGLLAVLHRLPLQQGLPWTYHAQRYSSSPLYEATSHGKYEAAKLILENSIYPADEAIQHVTSLYRAAWDGDNVMVRLLLTHGADPLCIQDGQTRFQSTPLCMGFNKPLTEANEQNQGSKTDKTATIMAMVDQIEDRSASGRLPELSFDWRVETLYQALQTGQEPVASIMLSRVSNLNIRTSMSSSSVNQIRYWWNMRRFKLRSSMPDKSVGSSLFQVAVLGASPSIVGQMLARATETGDAIGIMDSRDGLGRTALHYLMEREEPEASLIFEMLKAAGADMSVTSDEGLGTIHVVAAMGGSPDSMRHLISGNYHVQALDTNGANAMHYLALGDGSKPDIEVLMEMLIQQGLSVFSRDNEGNTPLHYAVAAQNLTFLKVAYAMSLGQPQHLHDTKDVSNASFHDQQGEKMKDPAGSQNQVRSGPMRHTLGSVSNSQGLSLLHVRNGPRQAKQVSEDDEAGVARAMIKFLVSVGVGVDGQDNQGRTPLMKQVMAGHFSTPVLQELLQAGASDNITDHVGRTVMHYAAYNSVQDTDNVKMLIDRGGPVDQPDKYGDTPLHLAACSYMNVRVIGLLVRNGANINSLSTFHTTPLHYADDNLTIEMLVRKGADLEVRDVYGRSPLLVVLEKDSSYKHLGDILDNKHEVNHIENKRGLVDCLLKHGADPTTVDLRGRTALSLANELGDQKIREKILAALENWAVKDHLEKMGLDC